MKTAVRGGASALLSILLPLLLAACNGPSREEQQATADAAATAAASPFPPPEAGRISGSVAYTGKDPDVAVPVNADPTCASLRPDPLMTETIAGDGQGHLGNVFVYVESGLGGRTFPPPAAKAELDQVGCAYRPHVLGLRVDQTLVIKNSDATVHNVLALPGPNPQFNEGLPYPGMQMEKVFHSPQVMLQLKCNVHLWMTAWIGVLPHPYFAVTAPDGTFEIENLPPGTYTLAAWHETLGTQRRMVTIGPKQSVAVGFDYGAGAVPAPVVKY